MRGQRSDKTIILALLSFLLIPLLTNAQILYSKAYGENRHKPIIFIHGGPSGNATLFEATTAQELSKKGFYVIVYDRKGEGRSFDANAKFTYTEAFEGINDIYEKYHINKASIIGHSFGGLIATLYSDKYSYKVESLVLAAALVSQQETYDHILNSLRSGHSQDSDSVMLNKVLYIEGLNKNSSEYRRECFELANDNGYFKISNPTAKADSIYEAYKTSLFYKSNVRNENAPILFYKNEKLTNIDTKNILERIKGNGIRLYAIYGKQDRIFSEAQLRNLKNLVGEKNFKLIDNCSHYLFADQQKEFIDNIERWIH